ncbi:hypothetical protein [Aequorivita sp. CIP111184]|uniref:hypothetical protein n=1 Tax=Aequorivita sp. CIP111184 TaxID=2211356 RepID=UPI000DBBD482|nr:hypothetical protein [Aequorivita sp. CIP111184]SRX52757.1 hypothetical protein AEQU1_00627 [Aequorivita sp. CIP111184]
MKSILKYSLLVVFLQLFSFCSSDEKINEQATPEQVNFLDKAYIEKATVDEKLEYRRFHLLNLATWLSHHNNEVRGLVQSYNKNNSQQEIFSVESLINEFKKSGNVISPEIEASLNTSLAAFRNLDGEDWYPYIQYERMIEDANKQPYDDSKPLYAMEDYENNEEIAVGYQENSDGDLEEINEKLTPEVVGEEDDIIVIGIGVCPIAIEGEPCVFQTSVPDPPGSFFKVDIGTMKVKAHKEVYPFRSDLSFTGFFEPTLPANSGDCGQPMFRSVNCYDPDGSNIDQYHRSWISNGDTKTQNYKIKSQPTSTNDDIIIYVIFEHDSWPATIRTATLTFPNGIGRNIIYRSWQTKYDSRTVSMDPGNSYGLPYANNVVVNNSEIEYNLKVRAN